MFKGVRFLISHPMIYGLVGSTTLAYELASYLKNKGADVLVYTHYAAYPMLQLFEDAKVDVTTNPLDERIALENFDYIWVHSQVIPESLIYGLTKETAAVSAKFIYLHMSIMDWIPDEKSYIWGLEEKTSSKTLFAWKEVEDIQRAELLKDVDLNFGIYQNPAPVDFSLLEYKPNKTLKNVLFMGNQLPPEVLELQALFNDRGYNTVRYSSSGDNYDRITPELLSRFDVVVTGSKSVYYCLCAGVPVYIYNYFGRQGYVTEENLNDSIRRNFSGRGYEMTSAEDAYNDLVNGYSEAAKFYTDNRAKFVDLFSINRVLPALLDTVESRVIEPFSEEYAAMVVYNQKLSRRLFINESERSRLQQELDIANDAHEKAIQKVTIEKDQLAKTVHSIVQSKSYRLGEIAAVPLRKVKNAINKKSN